MVAGRKRSRCSPSRERGSFTTAPICCIAVLLYHMGVELSSSPGMLALMRESCPTFDESKVEGSPDPDENSALGRVDTSPAGKVSVATGGDEAGSNVYGCVCVGRWGLPCDKRGSSATGRRRRCCRVIASMAFHLRACLPVMNSSVEFEILSRVISIAFHTAAVSGKETWNRETNATASNAAAPQKSQLVPIVRLPNVQVVAPSRRCSRSRFATHHQRLSGSFGGSLRMGELDRFSRFGGGFVSLFIFFRFIPP